MAEQSQVPESVTAEQFFEQLLPMGFATQAAEGQAPGSITLRYVVTGDGGGEWFVAIEGGQMQVRKGGGDANIVTTLSAAHLHEAILGQNGAALALVIPQQRPGRPDNSGRAKTLKGTMALELAREGDPFKVELTFGGAPQPRCTMKMKLQDYLDMQTGKLNGQEAFMTGKMKVEGDMGFLMQIAALQM